MRRREFVGVLGAAAAWPFGVSAQEPAMQVIGFLAAASSAHRQAELAAFQRGLKEAGYVEGQNVAIEIRWAEGQYERLPALAADLVQRRVAVIAAIALPAVDAAKATTKTIPIVFLVGGDPVKFGLVTRLSQPGGNITGVTFLGNLLAAKQLEALNELVPKNASIGVLVNPNNPNAGIDTSEVRDAARVLGRQLLITKRSIRARSGKGFRGACSTKSRRGYRHLRPVLTRPQRADSRASRASRPARHLSGTRFLDGRRPDELWQQPD